MNLRRRGDSLDAVVIGAGPNGLAAAITLAEAGLSVQVIEAAASPGGGCRTAALTLPGFAHDTCAAVHPLAAASPFFRRLDLPRLGVEFAHPPIELAHPLDGVRAVVVDRSVAATAAPLGADAQAYADLVGEWAAGTAGLVDDVLGEGFRQLTRAAGPAARLGPAGVRSALALGRSRFQTAAARALLAGAAAHSARSLTAAGTASYGLVLLALAHTVGWPVVRGGSGALTAAMAARLAELGGEVRTGWPVRSLAELPAARTVLADVSPTGLAQLCGDALPARYVRALRRMRPGPGVFTAHYALAGPMPWAAPAARLAGTLHLGGTATEIAGAEAMVLSGRPAPAPYVLVAQPSVADPTRAPAGQATLWAYCHVPAFSDVDASAAIEGQFDRFAPGWRDLVLARHTRSAPELAAENANCRGGDISGGGTTVWQTLVRPAARVDPYATPLPGVYLCSASTPPGPGVHGLCGMLAARSALRREFGVSGQNSSG